MSPIRAGAICWMLTLEWFIAQIAVQAAWPEYFVSGNDISLLGATMCGIANPAPHGTSYVCSPLHDVFNIALTVVGLLGAAGAVLTRAAWPEICFSRVALWMIAVSGIGGALAGAFPFNVNLVVHGIGAIANFVLVNAGLILLGAAMLPGANGWGRYTLVSGLIGLGGLAMYGSGVDLGLGRGIAERLTAFPQTVWYAVMGAALFSGRRFGPASAG